mmetsp:Transcript_55934/g.132698  ORF Transcript_55934/g.132698 Transcript_55934/m.132698 type:complete len:219 (+) Transcript_55934:191-847(+)
MRSACGCASGGLSGSEHCGHDRAPHLRQLDKAVEPIRRDVVHVWRCELQGSRILGSVALPSEVRRVRGYRNGRRIAMYLQERFKQRTRWHHAQRYLACVGSLHGEPSRGVLRVPRRAPGLRGDLEHLCRCGAQCLQYLRGSRLGVQRLQHLRGSRLGAQRLQYLRGSRFWSQWLQYLRGSWFGIQWLQHLRGSSFRAECLRHLQGSLPFRFELLQEDS